MLPESNSFRCWTKNDPGTLAGARGQVRTNGRFKNMRTISTHPNAGNDGVASSRAAKSSAATTLPAPSDREPINAPHPNIVSDLEWLAATPPLPSIDEASELLIQFFDMLFNIGERSEALEGVCEHSDNAMAEAKAVLAMSRQLVEYGMTLARGSVAAAAGEYERVSERIGESIRYVIEGMTKVRNLAHAVDGDVVYRIR